LKGGKILGKESLKNNGKGRKAKKKTLENKRVERCGVKKSERIIFSAGKIWPNKEPKRLCQNWERREQPSAL